MPRYRMTPTVKAAFEAERTRRVSLKEPTEQPLWKPYLNSPQQRAVESEAYIVGYGGAAGGGKTDLEIGLAITKHKKSIIFRREYPQLKDIVIRSQQIAGDRGTYNVNERMLTLDNGATVEFGSCQHEKDKEKYRGRPHALKEFDELTEFTESQFRYLTAWTRSASGERCRIIATFNPPTTSEGMWVIAFFAPWIDENHPNPALPGEIRWFAMVNGEEKEWPDGEPFPDRDVDGEIRRDVDGEIMYVEPTSRTFFPALLKDNPILARTDYAKTLGSLPEPWRSQFLYGDFRAGIKDDANQTIPTAWVKAAMDRWKAAGGANRDVAGFSPTVIAQDVAHGGKDATVNAIRYGKWIAPLDYHPGTATPTGMEAAMTVVPHFSGNAAIYVDAQGVGCSSYERLRDMPIIGENTYPIVFGSGTEFYESSGNYQCKNLRAEIYWRLREELNPANGATLMLPDDRELQADLTAVRHELRMGKIQIEDKAEIKKRIGRSCDKGDAVAMTCLPRPERASNSTIATLGENKMRDWRRPGMRRAR